MPTYKAPVDDALFLLNDVFHIERYGNIPAFAEATPDTVAAVLSEGGKFVEEVLQPLNRVGDVEGCTRHPDGSVTTPKGFKEAYRALSEGGWIGLAMEPEYGGQGLPHTIAIIMNEFMTSANMAFTMYSGLTQGAYVALRTHGDEILRKTYLARIASGEWAATMNLTEPHCGTDLGLLRTKALPQPDGSYKIRGSDMRTELLGRDVARTRGEVMRWRTIPFGVRHALNLCSARTATHCREMLDET
jgi:alkylation response protein AidB-like acyl-CoA dehydrogenase